MNLSIGVARPNWKEVQFRHDSSTFWESSWNFAEFNEKKQPKSPWYVNQSVREIFYQLLLYFMVLTHSCECKWKIIKIYRIINKRYKININNTSIEWWNKMVIKLFHVNTNEITFNIIHRYVSMFKKTLYLYQMYIQSLPTKRNYYHSLISYYTNINTLNSLWSNNKDIAAKFKKKNVSNLAQRARKTKIIQWLIRFVRLKKVKYFNNLQSEIIKKKQPTRIAMKK